MIILEETRMNLKDVKFINNGDIIYYRNKYYTITRISTDDYKNERDDMTIQADVIYELNKEK